jgi:hypothetical protein
MTLSRKKAISLSNGVFLVCVAFMVFFNAWWPWMIAAIGLTIAIRQFFSGRVYYAGITTAIAALIFSMEFFQFGWHSYFPALLLIAGIFIIVREVWFFGQTGGEDKSEEIKEDADI